MTSHFKPARASWMFADPYAYQYSDIDKNEPISPIYEHHSAPSYVIDGLAELEGCSSFAVGIPQPMTQTAGNAVKTEGSISQDSTWSIPDCLTPGGSTPCEIVKLVRIGTASEPSSPCGLSRSRNSIARGTQRSVGGRHHLRSASSHASLAAPKQKLYHSASADLLPIREDAPAPETVSVPRPIRTTLTMPSVQLSSELRSPAYSPGLILAAEAKDDCGNSGNGSFDAILSRIDQGVTKQSYAKRVRNSRYVERLLSNSN
ncbi:hypothetical protein GGR57DRAFT_498680 [Xylariaceae sp. FL1272]|nr:hypothetical protein GGR57DRAFT_498680 [Xylariaceae sp. FL1272]